MAWRAVRVLGLTLVWVGGLILAFLGYQLFVTDLINGSSQQEARVELAAELSVRRQALADPVVAVEPGFSVPTMPTRPVELVSEQPVEEGEPFAEIRIPRIELEAVVFEGVDRPTLKMGPGHMPWTALPGQPGNAVISGHRTTYGRPFYYLDELVAGDRIEVETAIGIHVYEVRSIEIVRPSDVWVTEARPGAWLTLTTCNPRFSARQRLIVFAELVEGPNLAYAGLAAQARLES